MRPGMDDHTADLEAMKADLTRSLTAQVEQCVARFVDTQGLQMESLRHKQENEQARLSLRQRQLEDQQADVERFVKEEAQALKARFGEAWPVEEAHDDLQPLARLQLAWRQGLRLFEEQLTQQQRQSDQRMLELEHGHQEQLAARDQELARLQQELEASLERKLQSEGQLCEEKASVERLLERARRECEELAETKSQAEEQVQQTAAAKDETQQALTATEYDRTVLQESLDTVTREKQDLETSLFNAQSTALATEQDLRDQLARKERKVADVQRAMEEQETELLQKIERVQQYMRERQASSLQAEKMQAVAQHDSGKAAQELRRVSNDRDRVTQLLMDMEHKMQQQAHEYEQKLARATERQKDLDQQVCSLEKENRDKNHEVLLRREQEHQQQVTRERAREQDRNQALVRRKEQELLVKDAKLASLRSRVEELEQRP